MRAPVVVLRFLGRWIALPWLIALLHAQIPPGDVFVSTPQKVLQYSPGGELRRTIPVNRPGALTGSAFDRAGNFYVTAFQTGDVLEFNPKLDPIGLFGTDHARAPESLLFDAEGNCYISSAGSTTISKFSADGRLLETYDAAREDKGIDWIDLSADGKTMFYTSEGQSVKRFDLQNKTQLPDFSRTGKLIYAIRILPDGGVLAANAENVLKLDGSGKVAKTYLPGSNRLFALNLDPDGTSFWTAEARTGEVYRVDLESGAVRVKIETRDAVGGLSVYGERTAAVSTAPPPPPAPPPPTGQVTFGGIRPCIFGTIPTKSIGQSTVDLSTGQVTGETDIEVRSRFQVRGVKLEIDTGSGWQEVGPNPIRLHVDGSSTLKWPVRLVSSDCPGSISDSNPPEIEVRALGAPREMQDVRVPVKANLQPGPWLHCHWPVIAVGGSLLVGLLIFYGFWSPCRFESRLGVMLGENEDLDGCGFFLPIKAQRGSRSGFYRDAQIYVTHDYRITRRPRNALVHLRADRKRTQMRPMVSVWRKMADGEWEELPRGEAVVRPGVLHRNDSKSIYFELRIR